MGEIKFSEVFDPLPFQDTWMMATKAATGRKIVEKYIDQTVDYYVK